MAITMTEQAANHVKRQLDQRGKGVGIRVGVKTTGCSGMAYVLEFVDETVSDDIVYEYHGSRHDLSILNLHNSSRPTITRKPF